MVFLHPGAIACLFRSSRVSSPAIVLRRVLSHYCRHYRDSYIVLLAVTEGYWRNASVIWLLVYFVSGISGLVM